MNHALPEITDGGNVVAASIMGAGRVRVDESAKATSLVTPGSVSFGLRFLEGSEVDRVTLTLMNNRRSPASVRLERLGAPFGGRRRRRHRAGVRQRPEVGP